MKKVITLFIFCCLLYGKTKAQSKDSALVIKNILDRSTAFEFNNKLDLALKVIDSAILYCPNCIDCYFERVDIFIKKQNKEKALKDITTIRLLTPKDNRINFKKGNLYSELGDHKEAIGYYNICLRNDSLFEPAFVNRGVSYLSLLQYNEAKNDFKQAIYLEPNDADGYYDLADLYFQIDSFEVALFHIQKSIDLKQEYEDAYMLRGNIFEEIDSMNSALKDYSYVVQLNPKRKDAHLQTGIALSFANKYQEAIVEFNKALTVDSLYADALFEKALAERKAGHKKEAKKDMEDAMKINANFASKELLTGIDEYLSGKLEQACDSWYWIEQTSHDRFKADQLMKLYCKGYPKK